MTVALHSAVEECVDALAAAASKRQPIPPLSATYPELTVEDAYAIQAAGIERQISAGRLVRGRKAGLTSAAMQAQLGVDEPDFGVLLDDMFLDEGDDIPVELFVQPRVVATMAFVLATDLAGPGMTIADALTAVAGVMPAMEIVDSRIASWKVQVADTIADNASAGKVVLGGRITPVDAVDLRLVGVLLHRNGSAIESAAGAAALGNPARCVEWVANELGSVGRGLHRGDIVLTGPLHRLVPVRPGDYFQAEFAHRGNVTVQFADRSPA